MIHLNQISYEIGERSLFRDLTFHFSQKKYGLVGPNGVGKSTLLKIITGELEAQKGLVKSSAQIASFRQSETALEGLRVFQYLEGLWEIDSAKSMATQILGSLDFERELSQLSGGEWTRVRLVKLLFSEPDFILLDEPTNNLDADGKAAVLQFVRNFRGGMIIVSHDRTLLEQVDLMLELSNQGLSQYGGTFSFYWEERQKERQLQAQNLSQSKKETKARIQQRQEKLNRQEKRMREGARKAPDSGIPKIILGAMKRNAQKSLAKIELRETEAVSEAQDAASDSWNQMKLDPLIRFNFESHKPPASRIQFFAQNLNYQFHGTSADLWPEALNFCIQGSERWLIQGPNGSGKTTLLQILLNSFSQNGKIIGEITRGKSQPVYLDQKYGQLNPENSLLDELSASSRFDLVELRNELAFFGFTGDSVHQKIQSLSGGELLKATLAKALLGPRIPEIMILDEPTNNLDLQSQELLIQALNAFKGAIILVSHDQSFVERLEITNQIQL